jgi:hypothetical protein
MRDRLERRALAAQKAVRCAACGASSATWAMSYAARDAGAISGVL